MERLGVAELVGPGGVYASEMRDEGDVWTSGRLLLAVLWAVAVLALWFPCLSAAALRWSAPVLIDHAPPTANTVFSDSDFVWSVACPSSRLCIAFDDGNKVTTTTRPRRPGAWSAPVPVFPGGVAPAVSCPSVSLCVALSQGGGIAVSTRPASGVWRLTGQAAPTQSSVSGVSCPSVSLCVAVDFQGEVITSRHPLESASNWRTTPVDPDSLDSGGTGFSAVACPSVRLCVAADPDGNVFTSTSPTGGASSWRVGRVLPGREGQPNALVRLSCPSASLCVAANGHGDIASSSNPSAGAASWSVTHVARATTINAVSCVRSLCVATARTGVFWSRNPAAKHPRWHATNLTSELTGAGLWAISCPSMSLCVGGGAFDLATAVKPTGPASAWKIRRFPISHSLQGISCPTAKLCVAVDDQGDVVASNAPAATRTRWRVFDIPRTSSLSAVSCASQSLCVATGAGYLMTSRHPTRGARAWRASSGITLNGLTCPSASLCVGTDGGNGSVTVSTNPTGGLTAWRSYAVDNATYPCTDSSLTTVTCSAAVIGASCPTTSFCLAVDDDGNTVTSTRPAAGASSWSLQPVGLISPPQYREPAPTVALSCPSALLCVIVNSSGEVETSTNPTGGASDWTHVDLNDPAGLTGVSCKTVTFCVAVDGAGNAFTSYNPTGGVSAWRRSNANRSIPLTAVSCASRAVCVAVDAYGYAVVSR